MPFVVFPQWYQKASGFFSSLGLQAYDLACQLVTGKYIINHRLCYHFDFFLDQVLQGSAKYQSNFGFLKDPQSLAFDSKTAQGSTSHNPVNTDNRQQYDPLYKAVRGGDLDAAKKFLTDHPEAVSARITPDGEKALHITVMFGHFHILEVLVQLMSVDDLELVNDYGCTALHHAVAKRNNIEVVKCMVEKNKKLLTIPEKNDWIPLTGALEFGNTEMARYLYSVTPLEVLLPENGYHGAKLLRQCYYSEMLDVALNLLKCCPRLAVTPYGTQGQTILQALATLPPTIRNQSQLPYWQRWIYKWIHVRQEPASLVNEIPVNILETVRRRNDYMMSTSPGLLHQLVSNTLNLLGIQNIYKAKLAHKQYLELLRSAFNAMSTFEVEEADERMANGSIIEAAERGNPELIVEAIKIRLPLLWSRGRKWECFFHVAVEFRQAKVFNLIHGVIDRERFLNLGDMEGNNLLHMAGKLAPSKYLNQISGAVLQMQRELQWFKNVESIMPPMRKESTNMYNMTPRNFFTENHKDLVKEGEKWTKETASSCTVVAALVATITFAAAFTVPGGNEQSSGYPIFLQEKLFMLFIISDAVSLFSSSTSALMFLGLLTSRYAEDDFLKSLPTKLMIGLSTLFISIATMMIAFCASLFIMLHDKSWVVIPVTLLACVPVTLYILLQFPLLVEIFMSTYGPGIFDRNVKPWP